MKEKLEQFCYTRKDFIFDWFSGTGKGGQHRNKHQNCLRLTHIPSGITVLSSDNRNRNGNIKIAFERLKPLLLIWIRKQMNTEVIGKNTEVVRTYNVPDNRVKDNASGLMIQWKDLDNGFAKLVDARREVKINENNEI